MHITDKLIKPVKEANYLNVENTGRYRSIIRLFYINYEKLRYWLYLEDVFRELTEDSYFYDYTMEQCQKDLETLVSWGNLSTIQDTKRAHTLEEFKNKKYRYQLSEYAVEIERMIVHLENLFVEGASLEPGVLERIRHHFSKANDINKESDELLYSWWSDLKNDFVRLNQNYQDYMHTLNSVKAEEMMKTTEFLTFKDHLIDYLRSFVKSLQLNVGRIEQYIKNIDEEQIKLTLDRIIAYEVAIPRMEVEVNETHIRENVIGKWESITGWFVAKNGEEPESGKVFDTTNEVIRKITRYASRIAELHNQGANRREEYKKLAEIFSKCSTLNEAHRFSASVFGIEKPLHIQGEHYRKTESINSGVYEEEPQVVIVQPRVRTYREKSKRTGIEDKTLQKEAAKQAEIEKLEKERELLQSYIKDNKLVFSRLPIVEPEIRDVFLVWLSKALERKDLTGKTEEGRIYHVDRGTGATCVVRCTDGEFTMPDYELVFEE